MPRPRADSRVLLLLRAWLVAARVVLRSATASVAAAVALVPLLWRRAPIGRRQRPAPRREARVIPFQPRRQAVPR